MTDKNEQLATTNTQRQPNHGQQAAQTAAEVMYQALITILSAPAFFDETKALQQIAAKALRDAAKRSA